ncbi:MAG: undecaprenyldiphospho-muramoylpentapeptide beta-N-acetylglucosaminyltransferase [bacterium]
MVETRPKRIQFAGGGTAGHLFPALAIAQEFSRRFPDCEIEFWGTKRGIEYRLRNQLGKALNLIWIRGFRRDLSIQNLLIPLEFIMSMLRVMGHFINHRPDLVFGTGGYVSAPVLATAAAMGIPTAVHEQNSYPGAATRLLSRWARRVYLTYEASAKYLKSEDRVEVFGNPVRRFETGDKAELAYEHFGLEPGRKTLFVFGGSQGGLGINRLMTEVAPKLLKEEGIQILWATGPKHLQGIQDQVEDMPGLSLFPFIDNIYRAFAICDLAVCRSGATTLAELTYLGIPAILIPFPFATAGHQEYNARELESQGAAICLLENEIDADTLDRTIRENTLDDAKLSQMRQNMKRLARPNAAHDIVSDLCDTILSN